MYRGIVTRSDLESIAIGGDEGQGNRSRSRHLESQRIYGNPLDNF